jgi:DNA invertase Pin-like site-specific DNA recombinase
LGTILFVRLPEQEAIMQKQSDNKVTALYYRAALKNTDNLNLDNQMQKLLCYAKEKLSDSFILYADNGVSGSTLDRPAFNALKADIQAGRVDSVVVADMARIGRNFILVDKFMEWIASRDVEIVSISDGVNLSRELYTGILDALRAFAKGGERV